MAPDLRYFNTMLRFTFDCLHLHNLFRTLLHFSDRGVLRGHSMAQDARKRHEACLSLKNQTLVPTISVTGTTQHYTGRGGRVVAGKMTCVLSTTIYCDSTRSGRTIEVWM